MVDENALPTIESVFLEYLGEYSLNNDHYYSGNDTGYNPKEESGNKQDVTPGTALITHALHNAFCMRKRVISFAQ